MRLSEAACRAILEMTDMGTGAIRLDIDDVLGGTDPQHPEVAAKLYVRGAARHELAGQRRTWLAHRPASRWDVRAAFAFAFQPVEPAQKLARGGFHFLLCKRRDVTYSESRR